VKVKIIQNIRGAPNGYKVESYIKNSIVDLPEKLAKVFLEMKVAEMISVPENKMEEIKEEIKKEKKSKAKKEKKSKAKKDEKVKDFDKTIKEEDKKFNFFK
jgi:hypothetical protein